MDVRLRGGVLALGALLAAGGARAQALPDGVTPQMVAEGRKLFEGRGLCSACHGAKATGLLGPNLTDADWWHSDGSYEAIVTQIRGGVPAGAARTGVPMPPRGGSSLSESEVRAVAAYVHSLRTVTNAGSAGEPSGSVAAGAGGAGHRNQHRAGQAAVPGGGQGPGRGGDCPALDGGPRAGQGAGPGGGRGAGQCPMHGEGCPMHGSGAPRGSGPCRT